MKTHARLRPLAAFAAACLLACTASAQTPENLLPEGEMIGDLGSAPRGWEAPHPNYLQKIGGAITLEKDTKEPGNFVTISNRDNTRIVRLESKLEVEPSWIGRTLVFSARMRGTNIGPGSESWHLAGVLVSCTRTNGKTDYGPGRLQLDLPTPQWRRFTGRWVVPADAKIIQLGVGMLGATGSIQIRDIEFTLE